MWLGGVEPHSASASRKTNTSRDTKMSRRDMLRHQRYCKSTPYQRGNLLAVGVKVAAWHSPVMSQSPTAHPMLPLVTRKPRVPRTCIELSGTGRTKPGHSPIHLPPRSRLNRPLKPGSRDRFRSVAPASAWKLSGPGGCRIMDGGRRASDPMSAPCPLPPSQCEIQKYHAIFYRRYLSARL